MITEYMITIVKTTWILEKKDVEKKNSTDHDIEEKIDFAFWLFWWLSINVYDVLMVILMIWWSVCLFW